MRGFIPALAASALMLAGCAGAGEPAGGTDSGIATGTTAKTSAADYGAAAYAQITPEDAKALMDGETGYVILDARTAEEYAEGHIAGAVLIPYDEVPDRAESELSDKDGLILVYCRSGRRSKLAAEALAGLGYTNVKEFGGIIGWPYETTAD